MKETNECASYEQNNTFYISPTLLKSLVFFPSLSLMHYRPLRHVCGKGCERVVGALRLGLDQPAGEVSWTVFLVCFGRAGVHLKVRGGVQLTDHAR